MIESAKNDKKPLNHGKCVETGDGYLCPKRYV